MSTKPTVTPDLRNNYLLALNALVGLLTTTEFEQLDPVDFVKKYQIDENALTVLSNMGFLVVDSTRTYPVYKRTSGLLNVKPDHLIKWVERYNSENGVVEEQTEKAISSAKFAKATLKEAEKPVIKFFDPTDEKPAPTVEVVEQAQASLQVTESIKVIEDARANCVAGPNCSTSVCTGCSGSIGKSHLNISAEEAQQIMQDAETFEQIEAAQVKPVPDTLKDWSADSRLEPRLLSRPYKISLKADNLELTMDVNTTEDSDILDAVLFKLNRESLSVVLK